ncbi:FtsK gamma domain-containing small terminase subunit [Bacillus phage vB_BcM_Sam112]|uniref:FtsK gamma domain-containing small terminase subunit n=1 Tax=Bacillus phage vB_BcM_Sam112 TaxID=2663324 RepID=A0A5Q2FA31_9CAUD|nr:FtsK gamma domain-containing small terminase subunit [Bacillus phage vB_BcM_Sam112]
MEEKQKVGIYDELFEEAKQVVIEMQSASVSMLQRRFRIGYTRASHLIDALELEKVIGKYEGSKPREVLIKEYVADKPKKATTKKAPGKKKAAAKPKKKVAPKEPDVLTPRMKAYCDYFIELGNQNQAAIKAGYSAKSARQTSSKLMKYKIIQDYIAERMAEKDKSVIADQDEILAFLTSTLRGEITEQVPLLDGDGYQTLRELDATLTKDRLKAAEMLGKRYAMWTENKKIEGSVGVTMIVDDTGEYDDEEETD